MSSCCNTADDLRSRCLQASVAVWRAENTLLELTVFQKHQHSHFRFPEFQFNETCAFSNSAAEALASQILPSETQTTTDHRQTVSSVIARLSMSAPESVKSAPAVCLHLTRDPSQSFSKMCGQQINH